MTPEEQSLREEIKRRLDRNSPKITQATNGLDVTLRDKNFLLQFVSSKSHGDRSISQENIMATQPKELSKDAIAELDRIEKELGLNPDPKPPSKEILIAKVDSEGAIAQIQLTRQELNLDGLFVAIRRCLVGDLVTDKGLIFLQENRKLHPMK